MLELRVDVVRGQVLTIMSHVSESSCTFFVLPTRRQACRCERGQLFERPNWTTTSEDDSFWLLASFQSFDRKIVNEKNKLICTALRANASLLINGRLSAGAISLGKAGMMMTMTGDERPRLAGLLHFRMF